MYYGRDTTLPVASNIPGVSVRPWPTSSSSSKSSRYLSDFLPSLGSTAPRRYVTIGRLLTIGAPTYRFIPPGTNRFCCTVSAPPPPPPRQLRLGSWP